MADGLLGVVLSGWCWMLEPIYVVEADARLDASAGLAPAGSNSRWLGRRELLWGSRAGRLHARPTPWSRCFGTWERLRARSQTPSAWSMRECDGRHSASQAMKVGEEPAARWRRGLRFKGYGLSCRLADAARSSACRLPKDWTKTARPWPGWRAGASCSQDPTPEFAFKA